MISFEEAKSIAIERCDGDILSISYKNIMIPSSHYPISWKFTIYHMDEDGNIWKTFFEIKNNGIVLDWYKVFLSDDPEDFII